jgi:hypothetical protein
LLQIPENGSITGFLTVTNSVTTVTNSVTNLTQSGLSFAFRRTCFVTTPFVAGLLQKLLQLLNHLNAISTG